MKKFLNTEPTIFNNDQLLRLENVLGFHNKSLSYVELKKSIHDYDGLLVGLNIHFDANLLEHAHRLKFIATPTTGLTHLDVEFLEHKKVEIISLKGEQEFLKNITSTAEHAWLLLLSCARGINQQLQKTRSFNWDRYSHMGHQVKDKTLGIVGLGRVGRMVANYGRAFGMSVSYYDPFVSIGDFKKEDDLNTLLAQSDFILLAASYHAQNKSLISGNELSKVKNSACLINIARGELIDTEALLQLLKERKIYKVALDVIEDESSASNDKFYNSKLLRYAQNNENLIITPHIGGVTFEAREATNNYIIRKIERYLACQNRREMGYI